MDPQTSQGAAPVVPAAAASTDVGATPPETQVTPPAPPAPTGDDVPAQPSKKEWVEFQRQQRARDAKMDQILSALGQQPPKPPKETPPATVTAGQPDAMAAVDQLRKELDFERAVNRLGIPLSHAQQKALTDLHSVHKPEDVGQWLAEHVEAFGWKKASPPAGTPAAAPTAAPAKPPTPAPAPGAKSDFGAPGSAPTGITEGAPGEIDPAAFKALPREKRMEIAARMGMGGSAHPNPYKRPGGK